MRYRSDSHLSVRESAEFLAKLGDLAASQGISRSDLIRQCLRQRVRESNKEAKNDEDSARVKLTFDGEERDR